MASTLTVNDVFAAVDFWNSAWEESGDHLKEIEAIVGNLDRPRKWAEADEVQAVIGDMDLPHEEKVAALKKLKAERCRAKGNRKSAHDRAVLDGKVLVMPHR